MYKISKFTPALAVFVSVLCLASYFSVDAVGLSVRTIVVLFWLAFVLSISAICLVRPKRLWPLFASFFTWVLLWPTSESVMAWSAWWINEFGP